MKQPRLTEEQVACAHRQAEVASLAGEVRGQCAQMMTIYGRGNLSPLTVDLSTWWSRSSEVGIGVDVRTLAWGRICKQGQVNARVLPRRRVTEDVNYAASGDAV